MSKRCGHSELNSNNTKKQKIENDLDDLWGDDLDVNAVDDCLMLATQLDQQNQLSTRNDVSILPSYNGFNKSSNGMFTSTQSNHVFPSTSRAIVNATITRSDDYGKSEHTFKRSQSFDHHKDLSLEVKVKRLEDQYETKIGEVSILRSQLQDLRMHSEQEQNKLKKEWSEKLLVESKQLKRIESELEFKNLEIVNLTQTIKDIAKFNNNFDVSHVKHSPIFKPAKAVDRSSINAIGKKVDPIKTDIKIQTIFDTKFPLRNVTQFNIFTLSIREMCLMDVNNSFTCANIQRNLFKSQPNINLLEVCDELRVVGIRADLSNLINCDEDQLEMVENQECVNQLLSVSEHLLRNLHQFLQKLQTYVVNKDKLVINLESLLVEERNAHNLDKRNYSHSEMGINAGQSIICITKILPHNTNVKRYMSLNENNNRQASNSYLSLILSLIKIIGKSSASVHFNGFLDAVIKLLNKINRNFNVGKTAHNDIICDISKEIILCGIPSEFVLLSFLVFLNSAVIKKNFLKGLCTFSNSKELQIEHEKKLLYYNENSCVLHILFVILKEYTEINSNLEFDDNVAKFFSNCIMRNPGWLSYEDDKCCVCVSTIVKLYLDLIYKIVKRVNLETCEDDSAEMNQYCETLKSSINTLHTLNFTAYGLLAQYVATDSQFKIIRKSLLNLEEVLKLNESQVEVLENLNKSEIPKIPEEQFTNIGLRNKSIFS